MTKVTLWGGGGWATLGHMGQSCARRYGTSRQGFIEHAQRTGVLAVVMLAIWAVSGFAMAWPLIVIAVAGAKLGMHARQAYWASEDDHEPEPEFTIV